MQDDGKLASYSDAGLAQASAFCDAHEVLDEESKDWFLSTYVRLCGGVPGIRPGAEEA